MKTIIKPIILLVWIFFWWLFLMMNIYDNAIQNILFAPETLKNAMVDKFNFLDSETENIKKSLLFYVHQWGGNQNKISMLYSQYQYLMDLEQFQNKAQEYIINNGGLKQRKLSEEQECENINWWLYFVSTEEREREIKQCSYTLFLEQLKTDLNDNFWEKHWDVTFKNKALLNSYLVDLENMPDKKDYLLKQVEQFKLFEKYSKEEIDKWIDVMSH